MKSFLKLIVLAVLAMPAIPAGAAAPQTQPAKPDYRERYGVLTDRNMFLRDRRRPVYTPRDSGPRSTYVPRPVEETMILTGVVFEEGEYRAYFEDTQRSSVLRLRVGESIAHGVITEIQLDAIEYLNGDKSVWVDVGHTLTGSVPPPSPMVRSFADTAAPTTLPAGTTRPATAGVAETTPLPNPDDPNLTLEERMKLRRAQQLNQ